MNKTAIATTIALSALFSSSAIADDQTELVIKYNPQNSDQVHASSEGSELYETETVDDKNMETTIRKLESQEGVESVEKNYKVKEPKKPDVDMDEVLNNKTSSQSQTQTRAQAVVNDPGLSDQDSWKTRTSDSRGRHSTENAYEDVVNNDTVRIGVADSGFYDIADLNLSDGFNFVDGDSEYLESQANTECDSSHGTSVSSIISAETDNGTGIAGMVESQLYAARVMDCGEGTLNDLANGIRWLAGDNSTDATTLTNPVDAINLSLSAKTDEDVCPGYLQDAINYADDQGIAVFAAAGNEAEDAKHYSPANCENVFTVGSVNLDGDQTDFSNYGEVLNGSALGLPVFSLDKNGDSQYYSGTSFSAPIVTGIYGMLNALQNNNSETVLSYIHNAAMPFQDDGISNKMGAGVINADQAVTRYNENVLDEKPFKRHVLDSKTLCQAESFVGATENLVNQTDVSLCGQIEINAEQKLPDLNTGETYTVFEVTGRDSGDFPTLQSEYPEPQTEDDPEPPEVQVYETYTSSTFVSPMDEVNSNDTEYGVQVCDENGENCDNSGELEPISTQNDRMDQYCESN